MCPENLQTHLELQAARLTTFTLLKKEVDAYLDSVGVDADLRARCAEALTVAA